MLCFIVKRVRILVAFTFARVVKFQAMSFDGLDCFCLDFQMGQCARLIARMSFLLSDVCADVNSLEFIVSRCFIKSFRFLVLGHFARKIQSHRAADEGARK